MQIFLGCCIVPLLAVAFTVADSMNKSATMPEVADIYADELDCVEICGGGNVRLVYVTYRNGVKHVVARLIRPMHTIQALDINCDRLRSLLQQAKAHHFQAPEMH